jgi:probable HAF family extracellular repeat protein
MKLPIERLALVIGACCVMLQPAIAQRSQNEAHGTATSPPRYKVSVLKNIPHGTYTVPLAIDSGGQVLGLAFDAGACNPLGCGAVWRGLTPTLLGTVPHALFTEPLALNDHGQAVGFIYFDDSDNAANTPAVGVHYPFKAAVWNGTEAKLLNSLPAKWSAAATSINNAGKIVGYSFDETVGEHGLVWHGTKPADLTPCAYEPLVNDRGEIVCSTAGENSPLVLIEGNTITKLPKLKSGQPFASGFNDSAQIAGSSIASDGTERAVYLDHDKIIALETFGRTPSAANGINSRGRMVGYAMTAKGNVHATFWRNATSEPVDLNTVIGKSEAAAVTLSGAVGINDHCEIAAYGNDNESGAAQSYVLTLIDGETCDQPG